MITVPLKHTLSIFYDFNKYLLPNVIYLLPTICQKRKSPFSNNYYWWLFFKKAELMSSKLIFFWPKHNVLFLKYFQFFTTKKSLYFKFYNFISITVYKHINFSSYLLNYKKIGQVILSILEKVVKNISLNFPWNNSELDTSSPPLSKFKKWISFLKSKTIWKVPINRFSLVKKTHANFKRPSGSYFE